MTYTTHYIWEEQGMNNVTLIGLGAMGGAIAHSLLERGYAVTVWNRSVEKAEPLVSQGAILAPTASAAIHASSVSIICVSDYESSYEILATPEVESRLQDRTLLQLTTGSPEQARNQEAWARSHGASYIDGAIAASPGQIGSPEATIFTSGARHAFDACRPILHALAGNVPYYGEQVSAAASVDLAFLSYLFGSYIGFFHAARILESDGLRVDDFGSMMAQVSPMMGAVLQYESEVIQHSNYDSPQSSIEMSMVTVNLLMEQAREQGMNNQFPAFLQDLFHQALEAGLGKQDVAALVKVMR